VTVLVDTNVLVYLHDGRFPEKQARARTVLRTGLQDGSMALPFQALVEFVAAVSRPTRGGGVPMLDRGAALLEAETLLDQFPVLYPDAEQLRLALRGCALYQLSWFDSVLWSYAEYWGADTLLSEDFSAGRVIGHVRIVDPFLAPR
jgi:predicted nucleic acid-binding protein